LRGRRSKRKTSAPPPQRLRSVNRG
jgi:hypothetical protein